MAIYHFSAKVIGRVAGSSAVASAAYRSASRLDDERLGRAHDFSNKAGVVHSEILLPESAPERLADRARLWNAVEAGEVRKDAQLAREVEFAIPREMTQEQGIALARDFAQREFVDRGMVADLNVHWDRGADGLMKPHAHVMLTMREVNEQGFGAKVRDWTRTELLQEWREAWATHVNERLASLDIDLRVDHRSFEARGIGLEPQHKIGPAGARRLERGEEAERAEDHHRIARENGAKIIARPEIALDAITKGQATFTSRDLAMFVHRHSDGQDQFARAMDAVRASPELVALGKDGHGQERFTSRDMLAVEARLDRAAQSMAATCAHGIDARSREAAIGAAERRGLLLSGEQRLAVEHVTGKEALASVVGYAGSGKSAMLGVAREAWEAEGYTVRGAALSGIAAENLEDGSGIAARTIASLEHQWEQGRELLTRSDVLVVDETGMIGSRQMERLLSAARDAGAKVVLVGDPEQLQAIEAGAAFRSIAERHGAAEITQIRRQREDWQCDATRALATGRTAEAIDAYDARGMVHVADTREAARRALVERWDREHQVEPDKSRIILTHTNAEVRDLNDLARGRLRDAGALSEDVVIKAERGERMFARGDRIMFLRNERSLGVKNGTLGTVEQLTPERVVARLDDGRSVAFDTKDYSAVDHGYAATFHKSQGVTVDSTHVLATPGMDCHAAYVGLSRHRDGVQLYYARDDFADRERLVRTLARERAKDMASDYQQDFAARRGIDTPERSAAETPALARERDRSDGVKPSHASLQLAVPERATVSDPTPTLDRAALRHARAVSIIFQAQQDGLPVLAEHHQELQHACRALDRFDPNASRDAERAYKSDPPLAHDSARGNVRRAVAAMQLEAEMRARPERRADRFVERWHKLDAARTRAYAQGDMGEMRAIRSRMGEMAKGLERDPQLESVLEGRKKSLGISFDGGPSLGRTLAMSIGFDMVRGLGIAM